MFYVVSAVVVILLIVYFLSLSVYELLCVYRNPFPLFHNGDRRLGEILKDKSKTYKTRSILKDIGYGKGRI